MSTEIEALSQALQDSLKIIQALEERVKLLEGNVEDNAAQRMAAMLMLRAFVQCSSNREEVISLVERMAAQMQVQPGVLLNGGKSTFLHVKSHLDWMTAKG